MVSSNASLPRLAVQMPLVVVEGAVFGDSMSLMLMYGPDSEYTPLASVMSRSDWVAYAASKAEAAEVSVRLSVFSVVRGSGSNT